MSAEKQPGASGNVRAIRPGTRFIGWREWVCLPQLGIPALKAKIDTGARTSALHAFDLDDFRRGDEQWVRFGMHPLQGRTDIVVWCEAPVRDRRLVRDSGGHEELRFVIVTPLRVGDLEWEIELTLTNRDDMLFRMLLGRTALSQAGLMVDAASSFLTGKALREIAGYPCKAQTVKESG